MSVFIEWNDDLALGISRIDEQHQKLVGFINSLHQAMLERKSQEALGQVINSLVEYTQDHFRTEEIYFKQYGYTQSVAHIQEHRKFIDEVATFKSDFEKGKMMLSMKIMSFLKDWLVNHIQKTDRAYAPFLIEKGVV